MPEAVLSVGPMPEPVSRYQAPLSLAMSMPAAFHSSTSAKCVPLLSPREANGAAAALILLQRARRCPCRRPTFAGSDFGPDDDEVVVHHLVALHAEALGDEFLLERLGMHEDHVGVAAPAHVERLPGAERDHAHLDAALASRRPAAGA